MTEDIWAEKAEKWLLDSCGYAPDTSVKELAEWMEMAKKWEMVFGDIQRQGYVGTAEMLKSLKEKAENWDKYTLNGQNITPEIIEAIREAEQKLEAIKTFNEELQNDYAFATTSRGANVIKKLNELLEASG